MKFAAIVLAAGLLVAACSGSDGEEPKATPSPQPPSGTLPDTSDWPTYESDTLVFTMKYPPTWLVEEQNLFPPSVLFLNEVAQASQTRQAPDGTRDFRSDPDAAWIEIATSLFARFGLDTLVQNCSNTAIDTTFAALPATKCGDLYWVEHPTAGLIQVIRGAVEPEPHTQQLLDAALATITFHE